MYLALIGWLYVVLMFSIAQESVVATVFYLLFLGVLPVVLIGWMRRVRRRERAQERDDA
ncbi:hypothetical protein [Crenobacter caeni]|uniref:hypothetical protein n=1 Tax=Crenobacter caeni TaxID=2705474 RepID=UPI00193F6CCB|nr:hypothetical protein [Crenobacter caeni]